MNVFLTDVKEVNGSTIVTARNELGKVCGIWHFDEAPIKDGTYGIEFTFGGNEDTDISEIAVVEGKRASFSTDGTTDTFTAVCEDIEEEGDGAVLYLRFSPDGLEMLAVNERGRINIGDMVRFSFPCEKVGIYPY